MEKVSNMLHVISNAHVFSGAKEKFMHVLDCSSVMPSEICRHEDYVPFLSLNVTTDEFDHVEKVTRSKESYVLNESSCLLNINQYSFSLITPPSNMLSIFFYGSKFNRIE